MKRKRIDKAQITLEGQSAIVKRELETEGKRQELKTIFERELGTKGTQCPFCLYEGYQSEFLLMGKKGPSSKRFMCPSCKVIMNRFTLERCKEQSLEDYARWLYWTKKWDMTGRIKFELKGSNKSSILLWLSKQTGKARNIFWEAYKEARAADKESPYYQQAQEEKVTAQYQSYEASASQTICPICKKTFNYHTEGELDKCFEERRKGILLKRKLLSNEKTIVTSRTQTFSYGGKEIIAHIEEEETIDQ